MTIDDTPLKQWLTIPMNISPMDTSGPQSVSRLCSKAKKPLLNARMLVVGKERERERHGDM